MSDYPPVRVTGAPGFEDFDGWLVHAPGDWPWWIVGFEVDGKRDVTVIHADYVKEKAA